MRLVPGRDFLFRVGTVVLLLAGCSGKARTPVPPAHDAPTEPGTRRVQVEVLNASTVAGLARDATLRLRQEEGLDVVVIDNATDTAVRAGRYNLVLVRRGDTTGVGRIREALGDVKVADRADPTRLVDLSVILGTRLGPPRTP